MFSNERLHSASICKKRKKLAYVYLDICTNISYTKLLMFALSAFNSEHTDSIRNQSITLRIKRITEFSLILVIHQNNLDYNHFMNAVHLHLLCAPQECLPRRASAMLCVCLYVYALGIR